MKHFASKKPYACFGMTHFATRNYQTCKVSNSWNESMERIALIFLQDVGIDLNAKDNSGWTALHMACYHGQTETVQTMLNNWKEFGIDINAQINQSQTALDLINHYNYESQESNQIRKILIKEYSQIEVTESVQTWDLNGTTFSLALKKFIDF